MKLKNLEYYRKFNDHRYSIKTSAPVHSLASKSLRAPTETGSEYIAKTCAALPKVDMTLFEQWKWSDRLLQDVDLIDMD